MKNGTVDICSVRLRTTDFDLICLRNRLFLYAEVGAMNLLATECVIFYFTTHVDEMWEPYSGIKKGQQYVAKETKAVRVLGKKETVFEERENKVEKKRRNENHREKMCVSLCEGKWLNF